MLGGRGRKKGEGRSERAFQGPSFLAFSLSDSLAVAPTEFCCGLGDSGIWCSSLVGSAWCEEQACLQNKGGNRIIMTIVMLNNHMRSEEERWRRRRRECFDLILMNKKTYLYTYVVHMAKRSED